MRRNRYIVAYFGFVHGLALVLGILFFTWEAAALCVFLTLFFGLGITMVFHRYLTHGGFKTWKSLRYVFATIGTLAGEGPPIIWVGKHRKHHKFSDQHDDPHSPKDGFWHAHIWWMTLLEDSHELQTLFRTYVPDLLKEKYMRFLNRSYIWWHVGFAALVCLAGWVYGGHYVAASFLAWGFFVRMCLVWHITWFVNSATHVWGYKNYDTDDESRNLWWVAALALGEGWHNNHHKHPTCTWHGHRWWELDVSGRVIWLLKKLHVVWDVKDSIPNHTIGNTS